MLEPVSCDFFAWFKIVFFFSQVLSYVPERKQANSGGFPIPLILFYCVTWALFLWIFKWLPSRCLGMCVVWPSWWRRGMLWIQGCSSAHAELLVQCSQSCTRKTRPLELLYLNELWDSNRVGNRSMLRRHSPYRPTPSLSPWGSRVCPRLQRKLLANLQISPPQETLWND